MKPINTEERIDQLSKNLSEDGVFIEKGSDYEKTLTMEEESRIRDYKITIDLLTSKQRFCEDMRGHFNEMIRVLIESCPESKEQEEAISYIKKACDITLGATLRYWDNNYAQRYGVREEKE